MPYRVPKSDRAPSVAPMPEIRSAVEFTSRNSPSELITTTPSETESKMLVMSFTSARSFLISRRDSNASCSIRRSCFLKLVSRSCRERAVSILLCNSRAITDFGRQPNGSVIRARGQRLAAASSARISPARRTGSGTVRPPRCRRSRLPAAARSPPDRAAPRLLPQRPAAPDGTVATVYRGRPDRSPGRRSRDELQQSATSGWLSLFSPSPRPEGLVFRHLRQPTAARRHAAIHPIRLGRAHGRRRIAYCRTPQHGAPIPPADRERTAIKTTRR